MQHAISWFEIPVSDIERAQKFYEAIFQFSMIPLDFPNIKMRMFPVSSPESIAGALCDSGGFHQPSATHGPLVYLNAILMYKLYLTGLRQQAVKYWFQKLKFHLNMVVWLYFWILKETVLHYITYLNKIITKINKQ